MYNKIVIGHSRHKFYNRPIWWYEFRDSGTYLVRHMLIPLRFLKVPGTDYYEYGGEHNDALKELSDCGFTFVAGSEL